MEPNHINKTPVTSPIQSLKSSSFVASFKKGMRPDWTFSVRLDEFCYFLTWPLVYLLGFTRVTPNQLALVSFASGIGFLVGLYRGLLMHSPLILVILLILRIFLDCADGQLARYTRQTSNLGALYDLAVDFTFALGLFFVIGNDLIHYGNADPDRVIPICGFALFCFLVSSTLFSYLSLLERSSDVYPVEVRRRFIAPLPNDHPESTAYSLKLKGFNLIFRYTWRLVSYLSFLLVLNPEKSDLHASALRVMAPLEYGMHLTVLALMILFRVNLVYFLIYEITAFCALFLIFFYHYRN